MAARIHYSRLFGTVELEIVIGGPREGIHALVSRAGTDDLVDKHWKCPEGVPNSHQLEDIVAFLDDFARRAIVTFCGVQENLPME